jgi:thymidylate kinase
VTPRNLFITVEGPSGSGKTTVATLLAEQLAARYFKTPPVMFAPIREAVDSSCSPLARHLYYYAGIAQASTEIEFMLREQAVVCDKYLATMLAYSRAAGVRVDTPPAGLVLQPDFTFLLNVPDDVRLDRLTSRGPITRAHNDFLQMERDLKVVEQYQQLDLLTIDNSTPGVGFAVETITSYLQKQSGRLR